MCKLALELNPIYHYTIILIVSFIYFFAFEDANQEISIAEADTQDAHHKTDGNCETIIWMI